MFQVLSPRNRRRCNLRLNLRFNPVQTLQVNLPICQPVILVNSQVNSHLTFQLCNLLIVLAIDLQVNHPNSLRCNQHRIPPTNLRDNRHFSLRDIQHHNRVRNLLHFHQCNQLDNPLENRLDSRHLALLDSHHVDLLDNLPLFLLTSLQEFQVRCLHQFRRCNQVLNQVASQVCSQLHIRAFNPHANLLLIRLANPHPYLPLSLLFSPRGVLPLNQLLYQLVNQAFNPQGSLHLNPQGSHLVVRLPNLPIFLLTNRQQIHL